MVTHSGIFAWEIPWTEEPGGLQSMGLQKSWMPLSIRVKPAFRAVQGNKKNCWGSENLVILTYLLKFLNFIRK